MRKALLLGSLGLFSLVAGCGGEVVGPQGAGATAANTSGLGGHITTAVPCTRPPCGNPPPRIDPGTHAIWSEPQPDDVRVADQAVTEQDEQSRLADEAELQFQAYLAQHGR